MNKVSGFNDFKSQLLSNANLQREFTENPVEAIKKFEHSNEPVPSTPVYIIVVSALAAALVIVIIGTIILLCGRTIDGTSDVNKFIPTLFTSVTSGAIGALAGLLAPSPVSKPADK